MFWKKKTPKEKSIINYAVGYILKDKCNNMYYYPKEYKFSDYVFENGYSYDSPEDLDYFLENFQGDLLIDIGSNHGVFSIYLNKKFTKIIAFEPEANNFSMIKKNIQLNEIGNIRTINTAVSNTDASNVPFFLLESDGHHSLGKVATSMYRTTSYVNSLRLDTFFDENMISHVDLLKVDVEGFELNVFQGAGKYLEKKYINNIFFEISRVPLESIDQRASNIGLYLVQRGYVIKDIYGKHFDPIDLDTVFFGNFIAS